MLQRGLPAGFIAPCLPTSTALYISCHRLHTEAVGSSRQIRGVSWYRGYRVTAKSANRIATTIQMLRRIAGTSLARACVSLELRRVHWSKEASSLGCAVPYWSIGIKLICYYLIIDTMMETIIR